MDPVLYVNISSINLLHWNLRSFSLFKSSDTLARVVMDRPLACDAGGPGSIPAVTKYPDETSPPGYKVVRKTQP